MPFTDTSSGTVNSKRYTAPANSNRGNSNINETLSSGPIAEKIRQMDAAAPGLNLGQRLTKTARDSIVGIMGDARTGGRFDANSPYYQKRVMEQLDNVANQAFADHQSALQQGQNRRAAAAQQGSPGGAASGVMAPPWQQGLPASMTSGRINGKSVVAPSAGNYRSGQFDRDMAQAGLNPNQDQSYQAVQQGLQSSAVAKIQHDEAIKDADARRALAIKAAGVRPPAAKKTPEQKQKEDTDKSNKKYLDSRPARRGDGAMLISTLMNQYRSGAEESMMQKNFSDKKTGKPTMRGSEDVRALMDLKGMPFDFTRMASPGQDGVPGTKDDIRAPYMPSEDEMLQNPQVRDWLYKQIGNQAAAGKFGNDPQSAAFAVQEIDRRLKGFQPPAPNSAVAQPATLPSAQPSAGSPAAAQPSPGLSPPFAGNAAAPPPTASPVGQPSPPPPTASPVGQPSPPEFLELSRIDANKAGRVQQIVSDFIKNKIPVEQAQAVVQSLLQQGHPEMARAFQALYQQQAAQQ